VSGDDALARLYSVLPGQESLALKLSEVRPLRQGKDESDALGIRFGSPVVSSSSTAVKATLRDSFAVQRAAEVGAELAAKEFALAEQEGRVRGKGKGKDGKEQRRVTGRYEDQETVLDVSRASPVFLVVDHWCATPGATAVITLQLPRYGSRAEALTLKWAKHCPWEISGSVSPGTAGAAVALIGATALCLTCFLFGLALRRQCARAAALDLLRVQRGRRDGFERMEIA
jgi:hypothetical protein